MNWFDRAVKKGIEAALQKAAAPGGSIEHAINDVLRDIALRKIRFPGERSFSQFVWDMAFHLMRTDLTMRSPEARDRASAALHEFLRDEKIRFGDRAYAWDQAAAETLAHEYETRHWEAA
jgi:hypothetical protein